MKRKILIPHQPSTSRTGPPSPFFRGEISPMFKERVTEALRSSSPTTPTPPIRIRRGKPRVQRDVRESSAGPSSSSTPTPPSSPTSRNTRMTGKEKVSNLGIGLGPDPVTAYTRYATMALLVYAHTRILPCFCGLRLELTRSTYSLGSRCKTIGQAAETVPPTFGYVA